MKIAVGLSGGVDSCVAAIALRRHGYDICGITMKMSGVGIGKSSCCQGANEARDIAAAQSIAKRLDIPHKVIDVSEKWHEEVLGRFLSDYRQGLTPNPCVLCNAEVKFGALWDIAQEELDFDYFATGHYARIEHREDGLYHLLMGLDEKKDQSYFLSRLTQKQLSRTIFPLGELKKIDVVTLAREAGYNETAAREESQDFLGGNYNELFSEKDMQEGPVYNQDGKIIGKHKGIVNYTVGQRKNLEIAVGEKVYVKSINANTNSIILAPRNALMQSDCTLRDVNFVLGKPPSSSFFAIVKPRYRNKGAPADVYCENGVWHVHFREPQFALAPGQVAVAYIYDEVIASGWIA